MTSIKNVILYLSEIARAQHDGGIALNERQLDAGFC